MSRIEYTRMSKARYTELKEQVVTGSLESKWSDIEAGKRKQTKADDVEERQLRCINELYQSAYIVNLLQSLKTWHEMIFYVENEQIKMSVR